MSNIPTEEEFFQKLSERIDEKVEDLKIEFEEVIKEVHADEKFQACNDDQKRTIARRKFSDRKLREASSTAIPWEGIIIGVGDLIDTVATQKKATEAAFKADPLKTMKGWLYNNVLVKSDNDGKPVWPETDNNKKFGRANKPLPEHSWLRTIFLFARPIDPKTKQPAGLPQPSRMSINGNDAIDVSKILQMIPVKFKAINKTSTDDTKVGEYRMNHSAYTKFEPATIKDMPPIETILPTLSRYQILGSLEEYHNKNEQDKARWVITEGSVANLNLEPNAKTGNMFMIISDESLLFAGGDKTGVMCWIPTDRNIKIDFAVESRVYIVGRTNRGKARDPVTNAFLEGVPGDVSINVYGLYAPEMFKVSPDILPVTEKSVVAQPEGEKW